MGLDMYLTKKHYVKNWEHSKEKFQVTVKKDGKIIKAIKPERISYIIEEVGYWRKANAIHQWFVDNVQSGDDDNAGEHYVSRENLKELLGLCNKVIEASELVEGKIQNGSRSTKTGWEPIMEDGKYIKDPSVAKDFLPSAEGFFFGSTDYDEYYLQNIENTKEIIDGLLAEEDDGDIYYQASW